MKFMFTVFILFTILFYENSALDFDNYTLYINQLSYDENFLDEYTKWSLKLFSQSDYLYGDRHNRFSCTIDNFKNNYSTPTSVHQLRPNDIKCIGAMGDSLTTGLATQAIAPTVLLFESRGISWSIGGDYTYSKFPSIPNTLREYNPDLQGFSTTVSMMSSNDENATDNGLNVANFGDRSIHIPFQAELLIDRIKTEQLCDWNNDWKLITLFIGVNDLCSFCEDSDSSKSTPERYLINVREALDTLYKTPMPRTLVNLVLPSDVRSIQERTKGGYVCQLLLKRICPCAAFPTVQQAKILNDYIKQYHQLLIKLINSSRYDERDDFTVVIQPFMTNIDLPSKDNQNIDFSYFAPDCFHFSGKGHSLAALSLWNNMFEPVGGKHSSWYTNESLKCPTKEYPYIFTSKNSAKALNELKHTTRMQTTKTIQTSKSQTSTMQKSTMMSNISRTITVAKYHREDKETTPKSSMNKKQIFGLTFLSIAIVIIIVSIIRRQTGTRMVNSPFAQRDFTSFHNPQRVDDDDEDDDGDAEVWNRPNTDAVYLDDDKTTKTHGTRIAFE